MIVIDVIILPIELPNYYVQNWSFSGMYGEGYKAGLRIDGPDKSKYKFRIR